MHVLATAPAGTADLIAAECRELGFRLGGVHASGVQLDLDAAQTARALVHLRLPGRLLLHLDTVRCEHADRMYQQVRDLAWESWLDANATFMISATGALPGAPETRQRGDRPRDRRPRGPEIRNHVFAAQKIKDGIVDRMRLHLGCRPNVDTEDPDVRIVARFAGDELGLYLDLSGDAQHMRGRRVAQGRAPLKENLAAAIVRIAGYKGQRPLLDPMAGSGTLVIEATQAALGIAPGAHRRFGVERWPHHGERLGGLLDAEREEALAHEREAISAAGPMEVQAADIERSALANLRRNLEATGLQDIVQVVRANARRMPRPPPGTLILANPPYGVRIGGPEVAKIYADLGRLFATFAGCDAWFLAGHDDFERHFALPRAGMWCLNNGPLPVNLLHYRLGEVQPRALPPRSSDRDAEPGQGPAAVCGEDGPRP